MTSPRLAQVLPLSIALALSGCPTEPVATDAGVPGTDAPGSDAPEIDAGSAVDAGSFVLPPAPAACAPLSVGSGGSIDATGVPDLAIAVSGGELGVAFVDRGSDGVLTLRFQRIDPAGALLGAAVDVTELGTTFPAGAAIATDGDVYVLCGAGAAETECWTIAVGGGTPSSGATIAGATRPALAFGAGGFVLAYQTGGGISAQRLDTTAALVGSASPIASGTGRPSIAPTDTGYVVGFATAGGASAQELDASGAVSGAALPLGASRSMTDVAITFAAGLVGASFIGPSGDAMASVEGHAAIVVGPGADGYGRVAVAPAADGIVAAWSDFSGFIGLSAVGSDGAALGASAMSGVGWDDNAHALAATPTGFLLATTTSPSNAPIELHPIDCP